MRGCACFVVSGGQKYVQRTTTFPNHSALTFKAVTKLDGILSYRDVILSQIPPIEEAAFVCSLQKKVVHKLLYARNISDQIRIDSLHEDVQWPEFLTVLHTKLLWSLQQRQSS